MPATLNTADGSMDRTVWVPEDAHDLPGSELRFDDGAAWRVEIPSVEGPVALEVVIDEAGARDVPEHRISQGNGILLQTDVELTRMVELRAEARPACQHPAGDAEALPIPTHHYDGIK